MTAGVGEYTWRRQETRTIRSVDPSGDGRRATVHMDGSGTVVEGVELVDALTNAVGTEVVLETVQASLITGWRVAGEWVMRKDDAQLEQERQAFRDALAAEHQAELEEHQAELEEHRREWQERTDALPDWIRARIESFMVTGGDRFRRDGWSYELLIAELAVVMDEHGVESEDADRFASVQGMSGNQHGMAAALVRARQSGDLPTAAGTVSALAPLTGSVDYSG